MCSNKCKHFPILLSYNTDNYELTLSDCGYSLDIYKNLINQKKIEPIKINNIDEQINCIIYNLKKNRIKHLDIYNGKNLCVNKKGTISMIDFDIASINNSYKSSKFKYKNNEKFDQKDYYKKLKILMTSIISKIIKKE